MSGRPAPPRDPQRSAGNPSPRKKKNAADAWQPPSVRPEAVRLKASLAGLEEALSAAQAWTPAEQQEVKVLQDGALAFLEACKAEAAGELDTLRLVRTNLETEYVESYAAVSKVLAKRDKAWPQLLALGQLMERDNDKARTFCQSSNGLVRMYADAVRVKPTFDEVFQAVAAAAVVDVPPAADRPEQLAVQLAGQPAGHLVAQLAVQRTSSAARLGIS